MYMNPTPWSFRNLSTTRIRIKIQSLSNIETAETKYSTKTGVFVKVKINTTNSNNFCTSRTCHQEKQQQRFEQVLIHNNPVS